MRQIGRFLVILTFVAALLMTQAVALGQILTPENLLVTVNEFTGSSTAPAYVAEYTVSGTRTQILFDVPQPGTSSPPTTDQARDLTLGPGAAIYLYNGTFDPFLLRFDLVTRTYEQQTFDGWSTVNNISYGGLGQFGQFVYATDMQTFGPGDTPQGIVRFDTLGGPTVRFAEIIQPLDLNVGLDGLIYALPGGASPNDLVYKFDPLTFSFLGTVTIQLADNRSIAADFDGSFFVATWEGDIKHYSPTGELLKAIHLNKTFSDIDIDLSGRIAVGTGFTGEIFVTNRDLDSPTSFRATDSTLGGDVFVTWIPIPEPSSRILLALSGFLWLIFARRSSC